MTGRRGFLAALAIAPLAGRAADGGVRRVAMLSLGIPPPKFVAAALGRMGWTEARNLAFASRVVPSPDPPERLKRAVDELLATRPDVVVSTLGPPTRLFLEASRDLPIVAIVHDPVGEGFAQDLARPGGRVTGLSSGGIQFQFEVIASVLPGFRRLHVIAAPGFHDDPVIVRERARLREARGLEFVLHDVSSADQALAVVRSVTDPRREAVLVQTFGGINPAAVAEIARTAMRARIVTAGLGARQGILISAWLDFPDQPAQLATLVDKILRGAKPAELPFQLPTETNLQLNLATARAMGLEIPADVRLRATKIFNELP